jgi:hypothetical protein
MLHFRPLLKSGDSTILAVIRRMKTCISGVFCFCSTVRYVPENPFHHDFLNVRYYLFPNKKTTTRRAAAAVLLWVLIQGVVRKPALFSYHYTRRTVAGLKCILFDHVKFEV